MLNEGKDIPEVVRHLGIAPRAVRAPRAGRTVVRRRPWRVCAGRRVGLDPCRALGLNGVRLHDLRDVAGTIAAATGASIKELMHRLGHASARAALLYQHATEKRDEAIADGNDEILRAPNRDESNDRHVLRFGDT